MGFRSSEFPMIPSDGRHDVIGNLCIETCQVYRWGPEYVPFQGFILIGQVVPKLWPFIYQPMTGHGATTSRITSQLMFI